MGERIFGINSKCWLKSGFISGFRKCCPVATLCELKPSKIMLGIEDLRQDWGV